MKAETLVSITSGLDNLRDQIAAEVEEDREEKKSVITLFETIRPVVIEKAGGRIVFSKTFIGR